MTVLANSLCLYSVCGWYQPHCQAEHTQIPLLLFIVKFWGDTFPLCQKHKQKSASLSIILVTPYTHMTRMTWGLIQGEQCYFTWGIFWVVCNSCRGHCFFFSKYAMSLIYSLSATIPCLSLNTFFEWFIGCLHFYNLYWFCITFFSCVSHRLWIVWYPRESDQQFTEDRS